VAEAKQVAAAPERRRRSVWVFLFIVVLAAFGGWWRKTYQDKGSGQDAPANSAVKSTLHLETFVLNLADREQRSYLRVGVDLGLGREMTHGEEAPTARLRDTILTVLATAKAEDLLTAEGKAKS
jgi:flagellar basal body-associated protein FliL